MKPWQILLLVGGLLSVGCCLGGILLTVLGFQEKGPLKDFFSEPYAVQVDVPVQVVRGEEFDMKLRVVNTTSSASSIDSVDFYDSLYDGINIISASPAWSDSDPSLGMMTFYYSGVTLAPGEEITLEYRFEATRAGFFSGDVDVCRSVSSFTTNVVTIEVVDP